MIEKILIAMVAGLFGILPAFLQWLSARNTAKSKEHNLHKLSNELEFLERLVKFAQEYGTETDDKEKNKLSKSIPDEVERIFYQYKLLQNLKSEVAEKPVEISLLRRSTLLYQPQSISGWSVHTIFYMLFIFSIAVILGNLDMLEEDGDFFDMILGMIVIFGPIFLILQRIATRIRKKEISDAQPLSNQLD